MKLFLCLLLSMHLVGCAFHVGKHSDPWFGVVLWESASFELATPLGSVCVGCFENEVPKRATIVLDESPELKGVGTGEVVSIPPPTLDEAITP